jgi:hypothetical protein
MSYQQYPCSICGKGGHRASNCKELGIPPDGFYKPAPGQHQHDEDCEDALPGCYKQRDDCEDVIYLSEILYSYKMWYQKVIKAHKSRKLSLP